MMPSGRRAMSDNQISASKPGEPKQGSAEQEREERRSGHRDRRKAGTDRRNAERLAEDIAPRRHPDVKGRRSYDR